MAQRTNNNGSKPTHEEIARRARELYEKSGRIPGRDLENWLQAESQLLAARRAEPEQRTQGTEPRMPARGIARPESRT